MNNPSNNNHNNNNTALGEKKKYPYNNKNNADCSPIYYVGWLGHRSVHWSVMTIENRVFWLATVKS